MQIEFSGRLGNQMFQYAFLLHLQKKYPDTEILINTTSLMCEGNNIYVSDVFNVKTRTANGLNALSRIKVLPYSICKQLNNVSLMYLYIKKIITEKNISKAKIDKNSYFKGYWQSEKYFCDVKDEVIRIYSFKEINDSKNLELLKKMENIKTIGIHVRRSDYLLAKNRNEYICLSESNYYNEAINRLYDSSKLLVFFSDDIKWCREHFKNYNAIFVDWNNGNNDWKDMYLMSKCDSVVIANSSFSWWGAYLNKNQDIYYPKSSYINDENESDRYPIGWKPIDILNGEEK